MEEEDERGQYRFLRRPGGRAPVVVDEGTEESEVPAERLSGGDGPLLPPPGGWEQKFSFGAHFCRFGGSTPLPVQVSTVPHPVLHVALMTVASGGRRINCGGVGGEF